MQALSQLSYTPTANAKLYEAGPGLCKRGRRRRRPVHRHAPRARLSSRASACPASSTRHSRSAMPLPSPRRPGRRRSVRPRDPGHRRDRAGSAGRSRSPAPRAARPSCCTGASCASSRRSTTRSSRPAIRSRRSFRSISPRRRRDDFGHVAGAIRAQLGRLDGLVHTAAFLGSLGPIEHQSFDAWQKVLRVNLAAAMALTRSMLPLLRAAPRRVRRVHARHARRGSARVLGRLRGSQGRAVRRWPRRSPTSGRTARTCASMRSFPDRCARRCAR